MTSSKKRVGGGDTTGSSKERTQGRKAEWQVGPATLPTPSSTEEVVTEVPTTRDVHVPTLRTEIGIAPTVSGEVSLPSSHEVQSAASIGGSGTNTETGPIESETRPVIAVSTMKGPAAFFNLARKFLVTYDMCDLSALEGAIVSAIDAAHLLERSRLATIVRIETSYVAVEPRRKRQSTAAAARTRALPASEHVGKPSAPRRTQHTTYAPESQSTMEVLSESVGTTIESPSLSVQQTPHKQKVQHGKSKESSRGKELRRARIIITVKRTADYRRWLDENPQHESSGDGDDKPTTDKPAAGTPLLPPK